MARKRLLWQLYPSYLIITIISLTAVTWYTSRTLRQFYFEQTAAELEARAHLIEDQVSERVLRANAGDVDLLCKELGNKSSTRITVIIPSGVVVADSIENPEQMDNHAGRPEIMDALDGRTGMVVRFSHTLQKEMMYVAIPLYIQDQLSAVLRTSIPLTFINQALKGIYRKITIGGLIAVLLAAFICWVVSRRISQPLEKLEEGAQRFAEGELAHKLSLPNSLEIASLAEAMNKMAAQLDERIKEIVQQRSEREAVLSSMVEGVLAVDTNENLIMLNKAAAKMVKVSSDKVKGRAIQEIIRNTALQQFVASTLASQKPLEANITLHSDSEKILQAHGTALRDAQGKGFGALVVLNDLTKLHRAENIRREFVANVSHELKTPVTAIKAIVETLIEEAEDYPEDQKGFLERILKQTNRLAAIIEDLLDLSRIERDSETHEIALSKGSIKNVLQVAVQLCEAKASEKGIEITLACAEETTAAINPPLLEQAVINLIDNAIKYSAVESTVQVSVTQPGAEVVISVRDDGCGIDPEHLSRLFERFYRVEKARSRELGGTGLGLAIAKHIVQAHRGSINVESAPGKGSTFFIHLPFV